MTGMFDGARAGLLAGAAMVCVAVATPAQAQTRNFNVPEQDAATGVAQFARQADVQLLISARDARGKRTNGVRGAMTVQAGLNQLLVGTGLRAQATGPSTFSVVATPGEGQAGSAAADSESAQPQNVVVTGSRIRGARATSPVVTITRDEMRRSGQNNLGEVFRALPQNFAGGQNPGVALGATTGRASNQNTTGSSGLNLRGLGADASLTLLNGTRLPYDGFFQATDVSVIPVVAIERVEVLLDGASAIYGSDAVAGVANIVLRRDFDGAEISTRLGLATDGGYDQEQVTGIVGKTWSTGALFVTGDYSHIDPVRASQRDYLSYLPFQDVMIFPGSRQASALVSGHQEIGGSVELAVDGFYLTREQRSLTQPFGTTRTFGDADSTIWGLAPVARIELPGDWTLRLSGFYGRNVGESRTRNVNPAGTTTSQSASRFSNIATSVGVEGEGGLFRLPGGEARLALGVGYRRNEFRQTNLLTGNPLTRGLNQSKFAFAEANFPLVSREQAIPLLYSLSFSAALRVEDYERFGTSTTPKFGVLWGVSPWLDLRGTWGRSFKAPTLYEQNVSSTAALYPGSIFNAPAGTSVLFLSGGNPDLSPERAEVWTAGLRFHPPAVDGFSVEVNWFDIDYKNRVAAPLAVAIANPGQVFNDPAIANAIQLNPTAAQQTAVISGASGGFFNLSGGAYDPSLVYAILDNRNTNTAVEHISGIDVAAAFTGHLLRGSFSASANLSWILSGSRSLTAGSPSQQTAGVAYFPAKFRGRAGFTWSRDGFTLASFGNVTSGVRASSTAATRTDSMVTVDLVVGYQWSTSLFGPLEVSLSAINLFDERPPFLAPSVANLVNYDSTNYSALGRVISFTLTKRF